MCLNIGNTNESEDNNDYGVEKEAALVDSTLTQTDQVALEFSGLALEPKPCLPVT